VSLFPHSEESVAGVQTFRATYLAQTADTATQFDALERDLVVSLAGPMAQMHYRPTTPQDRVDPWEGDQNNASNFAAIAGMIKAGLIEGMEVKENENSVRAVPTDAKQEAKQFYQDAATKALDVVDENWPTITRVAEALLIRKVLNQDDVDELIANRLWKTRARGRCWLGAPPSIPDAPSMPRR
jgi:hypothetical protein